MHRPIAMRVGHFRELRAWQLAYAFKLDVYSLIAEPPLALDSRLSDQLREAAASAPSNISEGFGRFDPADFGRLVKVAKASLVECQNHLQDAVDRGYISDARCLELTGKSKEALKEIGGLLDYLQSPEARRNAERIRQRRIERRRQRIERGETANRERTARNQEGRIAKREAGTSTDKPGTTNHETRTMNEEALRPPLGK